MLSLLLVLELLTRMYIEVRQNREQPDFSSIVLFFNIKKSR